MNKLVLLGVGVSVLATIVIVILLLAGVFNSKKKPGPTTTKPKNIPGPTTLKPGKPNTIGVCCSTGGEGSSPSDCQSETPTQLACNNTGGGCIWTPQGTCPPIQS